MQQTLFKFLPNIKHVLNQERDIIIHVILKKNKTRPKINYFYLFENFQYFWNFFFFLNKQNKLKTRQPKTESKHVHK